MVPASRIEVDAQVAVLIQAGVLARPVTSSSSPTPTN
jgi:hypothetical protein